jgi:glutathione synthase/RimK-type ligase-like ATP-grasp enzyme
VKKIFLVITSQSENTVAWAERGRYIQQFCDDLENSLDDVLVRFTSYQDLFFIVTKKQMSIYDTRNKLDLSEVSFVHFKNWTYELEDAALVAKYLDNHGIGYINSEVSITLANGKIAQMFYLAMDKLPVPDSFYARRKVLKDIFQTSDLPEGFSFPLIMKDNTGSMGDSNYLVKTKSEVLEILEAKENADKEFILQNFIPNDGDYRLLFMGFEKTPLIFRRSAVKGSHLNNISKGASGSFVDAKTLGDDLIAQARQAARVLRRELSGVDILINKETQRPYILEVNGTPGLATGFGLTQKAKKFSDYAKELLDMEEEE